MIKTERALLALLTFVSLSLPAGAQDKIRNYRFEFFGGVNTPIDKDFVVGPPQSAILIEGTHEFSEGAQGGVRLGYDGHRHWGMEFAYSYGANASRVVTPLGRFAFTNRIHQASSNALFYPWNLERTRFSPFITAGVGATFAYLGQRAQDEAALAGFGQLKTERIFAFNAGGGASIRASDRFGIRLDIRDYMSRPLRYGLPEKSMNPSANVFPVSGVFHQIAGTFGLVFYF